MASLPSRFKIATADLLGIDDMEISDLLTQVYVNEGFTSKQDAALLFETTAVRARGVLIGARDEDETRLAGMIILVPPDSPAIRLAKHHEAELHLLCVRPEYRRQGLGRKLVDTATTMAKHLGYSKLILWTQTSMSTAQSLYESMGFTYIRSFDRNGREYKVYEHVLSP